MSARSEGHALRKPEIGTWIHAYFAGEPRWNRIQEWRGNRCFFWDGYHLRWSDTAGFLY